MAEKITATNPASQAGGGGKKGNASKTGATTATVGQPAGSGKTPKKKSMGFDPSSLLLPALLVVVWVMFIRNWRKQKKKDAARDGDLKDIRKGDQVVTIGRIYGTIVALSEDTMTIKPDDKSGVTIKFDRAALARVVKSSSDKSSANADGKTDENKADSK